MHTLALSIRRAGSWSANWRKQRHGCAALRLLRAAALCAVLLLGSAGCGAGRRAGSVPGPEDLATWSHLLTADGAPAPFEAVGKVHFESREGEIDGDLTVRVVPPDKLWLQVHTKAMFGLVGERLTVVLPGDGYLLYHRERDDRLERWEFSGSAAADLSPSATAADLVALATARIGDLKWLQDNAMESRIRVQVEAKERSFWVEAPTGQAPGTLRIWLHGGDPERLVWTAGSDRQLEVRYGRFVDFGTLRLPSQIDVRAPRAGVRATLRLDQVLPRAGFTPQELEVGSARNPAPPGGVHGG